MIKDNKHIPDEKYPKSIEYKGRQITFSKRPVSDKSQKILQVLKVEIDEEAFEVVEFRNGAFESGLLPYSSYSSLVELVQDVIDNTPDFR
ncbi:MULTISPECIES: hypothetical protein [unclassified Psychrobacter]|uniref:hypothetical protein n=1 Tax=unclassified Psychrobacter TaxID=196806 RepID=UPI003F477139